MHGETVDGDGDEGLHSNIRVKGKRMERTRGKRRACALYTSRSARYSGGDGGGSQNGVDAECMCVRMRACVYVTCV
jgi:hypothetical protein